MKGAVVADDAERRASARVRLSNVRRPCAPTPSLRKDRRRRHRMALGASFAPPPACLPPARRPGSSLSFAPTLCWRLPLTPRFNRRGPFSSSTPLVDFFRGGRIPVVHRLNNVLPPPLISEFNLQGGIASPNAPADRFRCSGDFLRSYGRILPLLIAHIRAARILLVEPLKINAFFRSGRRLRRQKSPIFRP